MLVLSRKLGESIVVGEGITITVTRITKDRVRLGVTAPGDIRVDRSEVRAKRDATHDPATAANIAELEAAMEPVNLSECPPLEDEPPTYRPVLRCRVCREPVSIDDSYPLVYGGFVHNDCAAAAEHEWDRKREERT